MPGGLLGTVLMLLAAAVPAAPVPVGQGSSVADFLARARLVTARGEAAAQSPEYAAIRAEVAEITRAYRADLVRQQKTGVPPHSCPPPRSGLTSSSLMAELNLVPPEKRRETKVKSVFYAMMKKRYPCL